MTSLRGHHLSFVNFLTTTVEYRLFFAPRRKIEFVSKKSRGRIIEGRIKNKMAEQTFVRVVGILKKS